MHMPATPTPPEPYYPESDGKPMADNTLQFDWILKIAANLKVLFHDRPDVFASGNQFWYPVEGHPEIVQAPDAYVVFGRPKGHRPSWKQWLENNTPMTVVFEVLSPENDDREMIDKLLWYEEYGVEEYYVYDPDANSLQIWLRSGSVLRRNRNADGFSSPRLGIRFDLSGPEMVIYHPSGQPFLPPEELIRHFQEAQQRADDAQKRADDAQQRASHLAELTRKLMQGPLSTEEQEELNRLLSPLPQP
jgi:Uma2 family endonuclease